MTFWNLFARWQHRSKVCVLAAVALSTATLGMAAPASASGLSQSAVASDFRVVQQPTCRNDYTSSFLYTGDSVGQGGEPGFDFGIEVSVNGGAFELVDGVAGDGPMPSPLSVGIARITKFVSVQDGDHVTLQLVYYDPGPNVAEGVSTSFTYREAGCETPSEELAALSNAVQGQGPGKSLAHKLEAAESSLTVGDSAAVCGVLTGFIHEVRAQAGKSIPASRAAEFVSTVDHIETVLGC